jgi:hypothetical protein
MLGIVVATWFLIFVPGLSRPGLLNDADSIHAEAAREMVLNHNWVTLYINGIRYLEKAPLSVSGRLAFPLGFLCWASPGAPFYLAGDISGRNADSTRP